MRLQKPEIGWADSVHGALVRGLVGAYRKRSLTFDASHFAGS